MKFAKMICTMLSGLMLLSSQALAADYDFLTEAPADYYGSTSYEDVYGSQYNYGGANVVDFKIPEPAYGSYSNTSIGALEKNTYLNSTTVSSSRSYGLSGSTAAGVSSMGATLVYPNWTVTAFTSVSGMKRSDGSIGTVKIPSLGINMKVWEGETTASMSKGLGHYSSTSGWDGNVGVCGHNRGAKYVIGSIKNLKAGDTITYTTVYGTRTYAVSTVATISNTDWSYLQATSDNRITLTTCLANQPNYRVCVQAVEVRS